MKVTLTPTRVQRNGYTTPVRSVNRSRSDAYTPQLISFAGNNQKQLAIVVAETKPYFSVGGVATVAGDYISGKVFNPDKQIILFSPYYNGQRFYNEEGGMIKEVKPLTDKDKKIWMTNEDLNEHSLEEIISKKELKKWELEKIASKKMEWAGSTEKIALYKVKGQDHYMVYTSDTARMAKPYANGAYSSKGALRLPGDYGDPYAKYCKALSEFTPELEARGISPGHYLLNDAQTAYFPEYVSRKAMLGLPGFSDMKMSFVQHNLGEGYQQMGSLRDMFFNFATNKQFAAVMNDPEYFKALQHANEEDYFKPFFKNVPDDAARKLIQRTDEAVSASVIPIRYALWQNLTGISPVSEEYAKSAMNDPKVAKGLTDFLKKLHDMGRYRGILNGMSDGNMCPDNAPGLPFYKDIEEETKDGKKIYKNRKITLNGKEITFTPYETFATFHPDTGFDAGQTKMYPANVKLSEISPKDVAAARKLLEVKKHNMVNLFQRLQEGVPYQYSIGKVKEGYGLMGHISPELLEKAKQGKANLFVSWGRGDEQKGLDVVINAFKKFISDSKSDPARKEMAENTVLVLGGELKGYCAEDVIKMQMEAIRADKTLNGRIVFMNGFAPNSALAYPANAAIFPSRFAPCELTDLEAMKFAATPIVTELQGLKQKNFDPRKKSGEQNPTSYTTNAHSYMPEEDVIKLDKDYADLYNKKKAYFESEYKNAIVKTDKKARKYSEDEIKQFVTKRLEKDAELLTEYKKATDRLIANDLAEAMLQTLKDQAPEQEAKRLAMICNTVKSKVGWRENAWLHLDDKNKSSSEIYHAFHLDGKVKPFSETLFDYNYMPTKQYGGIPSGSSSGNVIASGFESFGSSKFFNKRVLGIAAGVALVGGIVYHMLGKKTEPQKHQSSYIA